MKIIRFYPIIAVTLIGFLILAGCTSSYVDKSLPERKFNHGWEFCISNDSVDRILKDSTLEWKQVSLPHTAVLEPLIVKDQWQGICWYRKKFSIQDVDTGKLIYLRFEGAMRVADIWVNGRHLAYHLGGYLPFTVDLSDVVRLGPDNEVLVRLDNRDNSITGPKPLKILDYNTYGGLYRDVFFVVKNRVHITDPILEAIPGGGGVFVTYPQLDEETATIRIKTNITNSTEDTIKLKVINELWKDNEKWDEVISKKIILAGNESMNDTSDIIVDHPKLWYPNDPELYRLVTKVVSKKDILDKEERSIGIRRFEITPERFAINGQERFLRGVNRHQEYPYIGYALSDEAQYRDAIKIKEAGFDYVRLSHYPHSTAFMDACDRLGLLVLDAIPGWQYFNEDERFQEQVLQTCRDMIRRDRNHPCVLAWEVSLNETWMPEPFIDKAVSIAHEEYPGDQCFTAGWMEYGYDIYLQARQHRLQHYKPPDKPYIVSEYGDWEYYAMNAGLQQDTWSGLLPDERSSRQLLSAGEKRLIQQAVNIQEAHNDNYNTPAFADGYWVMFDYNRGYTDDLEASGIMSINRLPKFSYYFFRSQRNPNAYSDLFSSGPMIFIASYWNEESPLDIHVYSNCEEVSLIFEGKEVARQKPDTGRICNNLDHPPFTFTLDKFKRGKLTAIGYINNNAVVHASVSTPGVPDSLALSYDESNTPPLHGVNDVIFVYAQIMDKQGTIVPVNDQKVYFEVIGDAELINQDGADSEAGTAASLVKIGDTEGEISILARSGELVSDTLKIKIL